MALRTAYLLVAAAVLSAAATGPFTPADLARQHSVSDARISPSGEWVAYVDAFGGGANLRLLPLDGKPPISLGDGIWRDRSPRWSFESSRLAWLSESHGAVRIMVRKMDTGAETVIANLPVKPLTLALAPEGDGLAFTARVSGETKPPAWAPPALLPFLAPPPPHIQVFVLTSPSSSPRQLSSGDVDYTGEPAWMLDGQTVVAARAGGQIYAFRLAGGEKPLSDHPGRNESPLPAPDGSKIAWLATDPQPPSYSIRKLWVMNADGSRVKILSGALDRDAASPQWSSDARTIYFVADDQGVTHAYAARHDGTLRQLPLDGGRLEGLSLADNGTAASVRSTGTAAGEVIVFPADHAGPTRVLASPNRDLLESHAMGAVEPISWNSEGQTVRGWLTKPPGFQAGQKYPLLVDIRDDPEAMCGGEFNLRDQIFAAQGFVVLCPNPRGTPGYGEEFGNLLHTSFPGAAADDVLRGVDFVSARGYIDGGRLAVSGGLLAAWLIGHTTRFRAAVARDPIVDWTVAAALDRNPAHRITAWMGGLPWEDPGQYTGHSPIYSAGSFQTPTLVIEHGDDPQAEELYFALQARKVECTLARFPQPAGTTDGVTELEAEIGWLARAAGPGPGAVAR